ncbi:MAG: hypothetical protein J6I85_05830 [Clostridia bacterium]|nr:hypothetical protein [Clostridia bacterium]
MIPTINDLKAQFSGITSSDSNILNGIYDNIKALDTSSVASFELTFGNLRDSIFALGDTSDIEFQKLRNGLTSLPRADAEAIVKILD